MNDRISLLRARAISLGDDEAVSNLDREVARARLRVIGRGAELAAVTIAIAIAAADLFRIRYSNGAWSMDVGHVAKATHHALWIPFGLALAAVWAYRRASRE